MMLEPDFDVILTGTADELVMRLSGELDMATAPRVLEQFEGLQGSTLVTVDLSELAFIDSTGLSALVGGLKSRRSRGGEMILRNPSRGVRRVLEVSGLDGLFTISPEVGSVDGGSRSG